MSEAQVQAGVSARPTRQIREFVIAGGYCIASAAAAPHACLELRWLRVKWLAALAELGITEEEAEAERQRLMHADDYLGIRSLAAAREGRTDD